ncbi:MAG: polyprenol phosphomannose-dependent alpha 1,6 mannosyltransferase MptB [Acidimicrobiales bacterium]
MPPGRRPPGRLPPGRPPPGRPPPGRLRGLGSLGALGALGTLASILMVGGAIQAGSPFALKRPGAWFFGNAGPSIGPAVSFHAYALPAILVVCAGACLSVFAWYRLVKHLRLRPGTPVGRVVAVLAAWAAPLLVGPPLFSHDIYIYAALGAMVGHGVNPYHVDIGHFASQSYVSLVDPLWRTSKSPYGPAFLGLCGLLARLSGYDVTTTVIAIRLVEVVALAGLAWCVVGLARAHARDPAEVLGLTMCNPVVVLGLIGAGHNDPLMLLGLVGGILLAKRGHPVLGVVACALATAIKFPAGLGIAFIGWNWLGPGVGWRRRVPTLVAAGVIGGVVLEALALVTGLGWGWLRTTGTPGLVFNPIDPSTAVGLLAWVIPHALGSGVGRHSVLGVAHYVGDAVAAAVCVVLGWRSPSPAQPHPGPAPRGSSPSPGRPAPSPPSTSPSIGKSGSGPPQPGPGWVRALGICLFAVAALGPTFQPWYFSWALVLLLPLASGRLRSSLLGLSVFAGLYCIVP